MKYCHSKDFKSKYLEVDFKDELKPSSILAFMQEVASSSADELGFGYDGFLKENGYGFITSNSYVKIHKPIKLEKLTANTWPAIPRRVIFDRYYEFFNSNGELCVSALSRWCLIDFSSNKILPSSVLKNQDYSTYNTDKAVEFSSWKMEPFDRENSKLKFSLTIANSEYDHYMHVNNTKYADYVFNVFSVNELRERFVDSFQINYVKQTHEGDTLSFYRNDITENEVAVYGLDQNGEIVVSSKIILK